MYKISDLEERVRRVVELVSKENVPIYLIMHDLQKIIDARSSKKRSEVDLVFDQDELREEYRKVLSSQFKDPELRNPELEFSSSVFAGYKSIDNNWRYTNSSCMILYNRLKFQGKLEKSFRLIGLLELQKKGLDSINKIHCENGGIFAWASFARERGSKLWYVPYLSVNGEIEWMNMYYDYRESDKFVIYK